eukprot:6742915-Lingulodinium_polyedra.AAC.1
MVRPFRRASVVAAGAIRGVEAFLAVPRARCGVGHPGHAYGRPGVRQNLRGPERWWGLHRRP